MTRETAGSRPAARYLDGPVAIIGAGIGGLTAALSLQHFGVPVRVFEQARALREIGAGVTITPNAMNVLDFLGIGSALAEQAGETLRYFVRSAADGRVLERGPDPDSFVPEFGAPYCNLHRADLHSALTDAVTNNDPDAILLNHRFDHLEQDGDKVVAHFSNRTTYEAPALIGADGGASAVRNVVFGGQNASYTGHVALRALVPFTRVPQAIIADPYALYVGAGGSLIHYPLRRQATMNLLGNAQAAQWQAEGWSIPATVQEFLSLFENFPEPVRELIAAVPEETIFRGIMQPTLQQKVGRWQGILLTAIVFSVYHVHFQFALARIISHCCWGLILGVLRERTGTLWAPAIAHALMWIIFGAI